MELSHVFCISSGLAQWLCLRLPSMNLEVGSSKSLSPCQEIDHSSFCHTYHTCPATTLVRTCSEIRFACRMHGRKTKNLSRIYTNTEEFMGILVDFFGIFFASEALFERPKGPWVSSSFADRNACFFWSSEISLSKKKSMILALEPTRNSQEQRDPAFFCEKLASFLGKYQY